MSSYDAGLVALREGVGSCYLELPERVTYLTRQLGVISGNFDPWSWAE